MRLGLLLAGLLAGAQALAEPPTMYRWVDKDGHVHYDDSGQAPGSRPVNPRLMNSDGGAPPPAQAAAAGKQGDCKAKSDEYARYKGAASITETDAMGNVHTYSAEERDKVVEHKRDELVAQCGAGAASAADTPPPAPAAAAPAAGAAAPQPPPQQ
jgi:hypothetical protein